MAEVVVEIPEELRKEFDDVPSAFWQLAVEKRLRAEFERLASLKRIVSKSKLSEEDAKRLADEVSLSLSKRYQRLYRESKK